MRRASVALGAAVALVVTPGVATAVGDFERGHVVAVAKCPPLAAVTSPSGVTHGFAACGSDGHLYYFHGSGTSYSFKRTSLLGYPIAVADDGKTTYAVGVRNNTLRLFKHHHSGGSSDKLLSRHWDSLTSAGVAAKDGKWWAVWDEQSTVNDNVRRLYEARTMNVSRDRQRLDLGPGLGFNSQVTLALRPGGGVAMSWNRTSSYGHAGDTWVGMNRGNGWSFHKQQADADFPTITRVGSKLALTFREGLKADGSNKGCLRLWNGGWQGKHCFHTGWQVTITGADIPLVAESNGKIFVAWSAQRSQFGWYGVVAERTRGGSWSEAKISAGKDEAVTAVGAAHGKALVFLIRTRTSDYALVLRRQA